MSLWTAVMVGLGGAVGTVGRVWISIALDSRFPWATLGVNVLGSLILGFIAGLEVTRFALPGHARDAFTLGFCGGFTTFSTFSLQTLQHLEAGRLGWAAANVGLSLAGALSAAWLGLQASRALAG